MNARPDKGSTLTAPNSNRGETVINLLIVDDEEGIREPLCEHLEHNGFNTFDAHDVNSALQIFNENKIDLVVLDVMMPGTSGLDMCRQLKEENGPPVILLTALADDVDKIVGLELGADDYVSKPFNPRELIARIRSVLRRTKHQSTPSKSEFRFGVWTWLASRGELRDNDGTILMLSTGESKLLNVFISKPYEILSRDDLLNLTQGRDSFAYERSVDNMVSRLRRKIELDAAQPLYIQTVWGGGYKFCPEQV